MAFPKRGGDKNEKGIFGASYPFVMFFIARKSNRERCTYETAEWHEGGSECYVRVSSYYTVVSAKSRNGFHINTVTKYYTISI